MTITRILLVLILLGLTISCGTVHRGTSGSSKESGRPLMLSTDILIDSQRDREQKLNTAYGDWRGTPYLLGGNSIEGIDCSAFTQIVFENYFNQTLPRHTTEQLQAGNGIRRSWIRAGDLIFFRTGRNLLHVGIYIGEGEFLHASRSAGVTVSNVGEKYWATRYLGARRVL